MADDKALLKEAQDFLARAESNETTNRKTWRDDVKFARLNEQWPSQIKQQRQLEKRPCLTINKLGPVIRQVVNDARQNRPAIKVMPQDDRADPETAEVITGLIRNIEQTSNADVAYDTAVDASASGGFGYWRVNLDYATELNLDALDQAGPEAFTQDICIKRIMNPLSVYGDPDSTAADSSDWMRCIVLDKLSERQFQKKYPKARASSFDAAEWGSCPEGWKTEKEVTIAEYWVREEVVVQVVGIQLPGSEQEPGDVVVMRADEWAKQQKDGAVGEVVGPPRPVKSYKVTQHVVSGVEVLETKDWPGQFIPVVPVYGDEVICDGQRFFRSLISDARGPQEQYNFWVTSATELVALAPRQPYIGPTGAFKTDKAKWDTANNASHSNIQYDGPVAPQRQPPPSVPAGDLQLALNASDDIKAVTGIYDASLGARSNETSGKAIIARQREGDVSTFHFIDNLARAIRHTGRIILDLIPKVYSTARIVRILGEDGTPETRQINQPYDAQDDQGNAITRIHDFSVGRYDLAVTSGPSFTTKREEAATQMVEFVRAFPAAAPIIGDLLAKNLDWPGADEIAKRLEAVAKQQMGAGQEPPDPVDMAKVQVDGQKVEVERFKAETERMQAEASVTPEQVQQIVIQTLKQLMGPQQLAA